MSEPARTLRMLADPISEVMPDHLRLNAFVHAGVAAADRIEGLEAALSTIRRRAIFGPDIAIRDLLDLTACVAPTTPEPEHE